MQLYENLQEQLQGAQINIKNVMKDEQLKLKQIVKKQMQAKQIKTF